MTSTGNKTIAKNTVFLYIRMLVVLGISLYTTRVILNVLGIVDYGIYNVVCGFVSMFAFLNNSMSNGVQRFYNFKKGESGIEELSFVYSSALIIQIILALIIFILLETIGIWYIANKMIIPADRYNAAFWVFQFSVVSLIFVILQVPFSAAILAFEKMDYYAIVSIADSLLKLGIVVLIPFVDYDQLIFYGLFTLLESVANFLLYYLYCRKHFSKYLQFSHIIDGKLLKEMTSFSGWNVFGTFAYMIKDQGLNVLLNAFFGPVVNAAKGIAMQVNSALQGFSANIVAAVRPQLVLSYSAGNNERVLNLMFSMSRLTFIMLFILSLPIMVEIDYILSVWLAGSIPEYTLVFTNLVLINMIITSMNTPLSQVVHATGEMKVYQVGTSFVICSILPISWLFLKLGFSPISTFIVCIIISIINQIVCLYLVRKIFPFSIRSYFFKVIFPCLLLAFVSPIAPYIAHELMTKSIERFITVTVISVIITTLLSFYILLTKNEKMMARTLIKIITSKFRIK